jgi:hypothetical protein
MIAGLDECTKEIMFRLNQDSNNDLIKLEKFGV